MFYIKNRYFMKSFMPTNRNIYTSINVNQFCFSFYVFLCYFILFSVRLFVAGSVLSVYISLSSQRLYILWIHPNNVIYIYRTKSCEKSTEHKIFRTLAFARKKNKNINENSTLIPNDILTK